MKKNEDNKELDNWYQFFNLKEAEVNLPEMDEQLIEKLIQKKIIKKNKGLNMKTLIQIAATILLIAGAFWVGTLQTNQSENQTVFENQYLLAVYGEAETDKDVALVAKEYGEWMSTPFKNGKIVGGQELKMEGDYFEAADQMFKTIEIDQKNQLSGYFIIEAKSYEDAKAIAETCPHLSYNGRLALRPFMVRSR